MLRLGGLGAHKLPQQVQIYSGAFYMQLYFTIVCGKKVKFSRTRYRALGPELIPLYRQSARR